MRRKLSLVSLGLLIACSDGAESPDASVRADALNTGLDATNIPDVEDAGTVDPDAGLADAASSDAASIDASDQIDGDLPPDPVTRATAIPGNTLGSSASFSEFLWSGSDPIQRGVAPGVLDLEYVSILRGKILDGEGQALSGARISILGRSEFGYTLSRIDGSYDLATTGGQRVTIEVEKSGFIVSQRSLDAGWRTFDVVPDIWMVPYSPVATPIDLSQPGMHVARGEAISDSAGTRRSTLLFLPGTTADLISAVGVSTPIDHLTIRSTEFTAGGVPERMPGALPPSSAFTYAVELSADEAIAADAQELRFSQPVVHLVEDFIRAPVGSGVPTAYYDRLCGCWVPIENGVVLKILDVVGGQALVDITGDDLPDQGSQLAELGVSVEELAKLAELYVPGTVLWRTPLPHLTPYDHNWPYGLPDGAKSPDAPPVTSVDVDDWSCEEDGSIISVTNRTLGEEIELPGTGMKLSYRSNRTPGFGRVFDIPATGVEVPESLKSVELTFSVGGQMEKVSLKPEPNQVHRFEWDGLDAWRRRAAGTQAARVGISYLYDAAYRSTGAVGRAFAEFGSAATFSSTRLEFGLHRNQTFRVTTGTFDARIVGLGGWTLSEHHIYDVEGEQLHLGTGRTSHEKGLGAAFRRVAGGGDGSDDGPVSATSFELVTGLTFGPHGELYVLDGGPNRNQLRRIVADQIETLAGGNTCHAGDADCITGEGDMALTSFLGNPGGVAIAPDGSVYVADTRNHRIRRMAIDGSVETIAGTGIPGSQGDGGPANLAELNTPTDIVVNGDCDVFILDAGNHKIRKVRRDGYISTIAGNGFEGTEGDGGRAIEAQLSHPAGLALGKDGTLYFTDSAANVIRRVRTDGIIERVAGNGTADYSGDGGPALSAAVHEPRDLAIGVDGSIYFADRGNWVIRRVDPEGNISTVAGVGYPEIYVRYSAYDDGPALRTVVSYPESITVAPDGQLLVGYGSEGLSKLFGTGLPTGEARIARIVSPFGGPVADDFFIPDRAGERVFHFDARGRHLETLHGLTWSRLASFEYDAEGRLTTYRNAADLPTRIERSANGQPTAIVGPYGTRTSIELDAQGWLNRVVLPTGEHQLTYDTNGLLLTKASPGHPPHLFTYDASGRLVEDVSPAGRSLSLASESVSPSESVVRTRTAEGVETVHRFAEAQDGSRSRSVEAAGTVFDSESRQGSMSMEMPNGWRRGLQFEADPRFGLGAAFISEEYTAWPSGRFSDLQRWRSVSLLDPDNLGSMDFLYDDFGFGRSPNVFRVYEAATRTWTTQTTTGRVSTQQLDEKGRTVSFDRHDLPRVELTYDADGRVEAVRTGELVDASEIRFEYGSDGLARRVSGPGNTSAEFTRDQAGRVLSVRRESGQTIGFGYDDLGRVVSLTPPGRDPHLFSLDEDGRMLSLTPPTVGVDAEVDFTYDRDGRLLTMTHPTGEVATFAYDAHGRLVSIDQPRGRFTRVYHPTSGQVVSASTPEGTTVEYGHDGALLTLQRWSGLVNGTVSQSWNQLAQVEESTIMGMPTFFSYDDDGLRIRAGELELLRDVVTGKISRMTLGNVTVDEVRDSRERIVGISAELAGAPLLTLTYGYDETGRVASLIESDGTTTTQFDYAFDHGQLSEVRRDGTLVDSLTYDANGNRLTRNAEVYSYDAQDRLLARGEVTYSYDPMGTLESRTGPVGATYDYDMAGSLMSVRQDSATITYVVDADQRRVGKLKDGVLERGFLYHDQSRVAAELDASGAVVSRFVYAADRQTPDFMVRDGTSFMLIKDQLGSVRRVVEVASGDLVQELDYDAFGFVTRDSNPGFQPFGFAGGIYDPDTGLVRFGARDYDPVSGRFTSKDPIHFLGGSTNLYSYVFNNPTTLTDNSGKCELFCIGVIAAVAITGLVVAGLNSLTEVGEKSNLGVRAPEDTTAEAFEEYASKAEERARCDAAFLAGANGISTATGLVPGGKTGVVDAAAGLAIGAVADSAATGEAPKTVLESVAQFIFRD